MTLADRVQQIVDAYWGGSVNAAAIALGIPQQTLQRVATGVTLEPRVRVLDAIAKGARTSVDWLLNGNGQGPQSQDETGRPVSGGTAHWDRVLRLLYPEREFVGDLLREVPFAPITFAARIGERLDADSPRGRNRSHSRPLFESSLRAVDACSVAWAKLLEDAISAYGAATVRERLAPMVMLAAGGFTTFSMLHGETASGRAEAKRYLADWEKGRDAQPSVLRSVRRRIGARGPEF